jgi:hypothetical protein
MREDASSLRACNELLAARCECADVDLNSTVTLDPMSRSFGASQMAVTAIVKFVERAIGHPRSDAGERGLRYGHFRLGGMSLVAAGGAPIGPSPQLDRFCE